LSELVGGGAHRLFGGAKMAEERFALGGADAGHVVQRIFEKGLFAALAVEGDSKAVRFVTDALKEEEDGMVGA
jgi:hypothetical protein